MGYTIQFHRASADTSGTYSDVASGTVTALTGYSALTATNVRLPGGVPHVPEDEQITFLGGEKSSVKNYRRVWEMTFLNAAHKTSTINDVDKYEDFLSFVLHANYPYLWMDMSAYSTASGRVNPWHTANTFIPIVIDDWAISVNEKEGTETLTVTISHRWRNK